MDTWMVITIGHRKYAVKSDFVVAVTELKHNTLIMETDIPFVRGKYSVFNVDLNIIDGYKITRETSKNATKLEFSKEMTSLKLDIEKFIDSAQLAIMMKDSSEYDEIQKGSIEILDEVNGIHKSSDTYLNRLITRLIENSTIIVGRVGKLIVEYTKGTQGITSSINEIDLIKQEYTRKIHDLVDSIIDYYNSNISEMCIVFKTSKTSFGMTIDGIELIKDVENNVRRVQKTVLSMGTINILDTEYNVLDLAKLGRVAYNN